ncbi:hypothetical protein PBAL39_15349 [Pedobacter sp. BAL39]|nr:hypothetical protein PBAL39_15349 [Pedobacter sp. BAL39]
MDRLPHLLQTLSQNIIDNIDYDDLEFIILDYNSSQEIFNPLYRNFRTEIESGRVKIFRTNDPLHYNMSHSRNMAFNLASGDILCNIDADNFTGKGFAAYVQRMFHFNGAIFLTTHNIKHVNNDVLGRICVRREDFQNVNGYDERMKHYGFDDFDLANRLEGLGLRKLQISKHFLSAVKHSNATRMTNFPGGKSHYDVLIRYENPYCSELILRFKNGTYSRAHIINNHIKAAIERCRNPLPLNKHFKFSIQEHKWIEGTWTESSKSLYLNFSNNNTIIKRFKNDVYQTKEQHLFYKITNPGLLEVTLFFYNQISNRNIMDENLMNKRFKVNDGGYGKGKYVTYTL